MHLDGICGKIHLKRKGVGEKGGKGIDNLGKAIEVRCCAPEDAFGKMYLKRKGAGEEKGDGVYLGKTINVT